MKKAIAIRIDYVSPRTNISITERRVLTDYDNDTHKLHKVIETLQNKIKAGYVLDRVPGISYQVCDDMIQAMAASCKL